MKKIVALLLSVLCLTPLALASNTNNSTLSSEPIYLSQEDIFLALSKSYQDSFLIHSIATKAEKFSRFTSQEYGGMYLDDEGNLILCFAEGSAFLKQTRAQNSSTLTHLNDSISQGTVRSVQVKSVAYSESALLSLRDLLLDQYNDGKHILNMSLDSENNRLTVGVSNSESIDAILNFLSDRYDPEMIHFELVDPQAQKMKPIADIYPTTRVRDTNLNSGVTIGANLYIPRAFILKATANKVIFLNQNIGQNKNRDTLVLEAFRAQQ